MQKRSLAGPIVMTAIGGSCLVSAIVYFIYAVAFSAFGRTLRHYSSYGGLQIDVSGATTVTFWILTVICLGAGIPLFIVGLKKLKSTIAWNRTVNAAPKQPVYAQPISQAAPQPASQIPKTRYCTACGAVLTEGTSYCPVCGKKAE